MDIVTMLIDAAQKAGVVPTALPDVINRGRAAFTDALNPTQDEVTWWAKWLAQDAPHLFPRAEPGTGQPPVAMLPGSRRLRRTEFPLTFEEANMAKTSVTWMRKLLDLTSRRYSKLGSV